MNPSSSDREIEQKSELFLSLLLPVRNRLAQYALALARDRSAAEDLVSDTILAAYEGFSRVRDHSAFIGYLFTIALRLHRRARWRRRLFGRYDEHRAQSRPDLRAAPDVQTDVALLRSALARLPLKYRETVVLFEIAGLSLQEIHTIQGGSFSAVKSRLVRGRRKLAVLLGATEEPEVDDRSGAGRAAGASPRASGAPMNMESKRHEETDQTVARFF